MSEVREERTPKNKYDLDGEYGIGYTSKGDRFLFDLEDYEKIKNYCWYMNAKGYIMAHARRGGSQKVKLHQVIMGNPPKGKQIDHIRSSEECPNRKADNRKQNLRFATPAENSHNRGIRSDNTSGHTGVHWDKRMRRWIARVRKGKEVKKKRFPADQFKAACTWQEKMARKMFGKYAYTCNA